MGEFRAGMIDEIRARPLTETLLIAPHRRPTGAIRDGLFMVSGFPSPW